MNNGRQLKLQAKPPCFLLVPFLRSAFATKYQAGHACQLLAPWTLPHKVLVDAAGQMNVQHEIVRVTPLMSHIPLRTLATSDLPSPVKSPTKTATDIIVGPKGAAEIDVNINYTAGCQRGHISRLSLPVSPPFRSVT